MPKAAPSLVDTKQELRLVQSPIRAALIVTTAIIMAIICTGMALKLFPVVGGQSLFPPLSGTPTPVAPAPLTGKQQLYWALGAALFALGAVAVWKNSFGEKRPVLTLTPQGFHFNTISQRIIPWSAVTGIHNWRQRRGTVMIVKVSDDVWDTAGMTTEALAARAGNKLAGIDGVAISPSGLPVSFRDLIRTFQAYAEAHGGRIG